MNKNNLKRQDTSVGYEMAENYKSNLHLNDNFEGQWYLHDVSYYDEVKLDFQQNKFWIFRHLLEKEAE